MKEFTLTVCRIPFKYSGASISGSVLIENGWDEIELYIAELRKLLSSKSCPRLASLCGLVAGKDDEQDVGQLHLQHPLHCGAPLRTQHKVDEHGDSNVVLYVVG